MTILTKIPETINVVTKDLKKNTPALVKKHIDGYTIVLNARYSHERLQAALVHELKHIENKHFELSADMAEKLVRDIPIKREPFFYWMYEALAIVDYLKEQDQIRRARRAPQATKEVDAWIETLKKEERRKTRRRKKVDVISDWEAEELRRKVGLA